MGSDVFAYVGSYTSADRNGRGAGISVFCIQAPDVPWRPVQTLASADNPALLRTGPDGTVLYAVHGARTSISAFAVDAPSGRIESRGSQASGGRNPVDLAFVGGGRFLVTANYSSGTVALLPVDPDGGLRPVCQTITVERPGYDFDRAAGAMPHGVTVDGSGRFVLIPSKGLDCVFIFAFDEAGQLLTAAVPYAACNAGSGPRHAVFHPSLPMLYVVGELGSSVQLFGWNAERGSLHEMQTVSTLPATGAPPNAAAEIAISASGRVLYASNRGHDSIVSFPVDEATGLLGEAEWTPCYGKEPRFFVLASDGRTLHVANQESDTIVSFPLDAGGQLGRPAVSAQVGSPSSICFGAPGLNRAAPE
jgi:6-phosphogluconolactonase (cycloisomerase 2 family)